MCPKGFQRAIGKPSGWAMEQSTKDEKANDS